MEETAVKRKRSKKGAIIFIAVLLALLALSLPLLFLDIDDLFERAPVREIKYYPADFTNSIWDSEEYASYFPLYLRICEDGFANYETTPFSNIEEAKISFADAEKYQHGASAIANYFYATLVGCDSVEEEKAFRALFTEDYEDGIPTFFPGQKVYNIQMFYEGQGDGGTEIWKVSFDIVKNDGTVFNYTGARDGGNARFFLKSGTDGVYRISDIVGIVKVN